MRSSRSTAGHSLLYFTMFPCVILACDLQQPSVEHPLEVVLEGPKLHLTHVDSGADNFLSVSPFLLDSYMIHSDISFFHSQQRSQ